MRSLSRSRRRDEQGAIAIIVALCMLALLLIAALVVDIGLVRVDRQVTKAAADSAAIAGLYDLDEGGTAHPYRGVCTALRYLAENDERFEGVTSTSGSWTNGNGDATANGCTDTTLQNTSCVPGDLSTWARFTWTGTFAGEPIQAVVQSGYDISSSTYIEEGLAAVAADNNDGAQGCHQLAVIVTQNREPGLGALATSSDLVSTIRSVGRVKLSPGGDAPAMLLLKRTGCPILNTGSNSVGDSTIRVFGDVSSDGKSQAGTIHADSNGNSCSGGSNQNIFLGRAANGIVALAAPLVSNPSQPDPSKPGSITSVAAGNGYGQGVGYDLLANVFGSGAINEAGIASASKAAVSGRGMVTRKLVDDRYLQAVTNAVTTASSTVFSVLTPTNANTTYGYKVLNSCNATSADLSFLALTSTDKLFVNCTHNNGYVGTLPLVAKEVVFNGTVNPGGAILSLPNATKVYIFGLSGKDAINLGGGGGFAVHTAGNIDGATGRCSESTTSSTNKAVVVTKRGGVKEANGGVLRMCYTTMINMGGDSDGCLPSLPSVGDAPTMSPCSTGMGSGQLSQTGGDVDWTAPNALDITTDANGDPLPSALAAWGDQNGPEDLAFWSESAGNNSSTTYNMNGQGILHTVGVYMVPNADSFSIGGGSLQQLVNAQYIATSIALNGAGTKIEMRVDPNAVITLPELPPVGLVR